jgi:small-conductance mechanosensitive channel
MSVKWIPIEKIQPLITYEAFGITFFLMVLAYLFYYFVFKRLSERRHGQLRRRFVMTTAFVLLSGLTSGLHWLLFWQNVTDPMMLRIASYVGLIGLLLGAVAIIKVAQIYVYLYLFFNNISTGVPRLISNMFTFVFSLFIFGLIGSSVFNLNIATVATTSAVFSLVLGLALQDTLGNFFSGLALQIDRPFQINDWVEIQNGDQKWVGQIHEVNWRATFLLSFADEMIMFPNKTIAQSQIVILTHNLRPIRLNQVFRFTYDTPIELAKQALLEGTQGLAEIMTTPCPATLVTETTESWMTIKVFYSLHDYGQRYQVADLLITRIMAAIQKHNLKLAHQTLIVRN